MRWAPPARLSPSALFSGASLGKRASPQPGQAARVALGAVFAVIGAAILTGFDHRLESVMVAAMPDWLTAFATSL